MPSGHTRAAVFSGPDSDLEVRELPLPEPGPGEAIVRTAYCTLCRSDLHTFEGRRATPVPTVLGHEVLGHIASIGPGEPPTDVDGQGLSIGDRVTWSVTVHCGGCYFCDRGLPQKCASLFKYGHSALGDGDGPSGGLAEHIHLRAGTSFVRVPDVLTDAVACPANCATATVVAALRIVGGVEGKTVLVQGAGMLGLNACALAMTQGAAAVIAVDHKQPARTRALAFGAQHALDVAPTATLAKQVQALSEGRGADVALEMTGATDSIDAGLASLRTGGDHVWVGSVMPSPGVTIDPETVTRRMLHIHGLHNYRPEDLAEAVRFLALTHDRFPFAELVGEELGLDAVSEAFRLGLSAQTPRVAIRL